MHMLANSEPMGGKQQYRFLSENQDGNAYTGSKKGMGAGMSMDLAQPALAPLIIKVLMFSAEVGPS
jgi:hypothetical protein